MHHDRDGALNGAGRRMPNRRNAARRRVLTFAMVMAAGPAIAVLGQASLEAGGPEGRKIVAESRFDVANGPLQGEVVQLVVDFPSGEWTSWHTHGGKAINLVLDGEITLRNADLRRTPRRRPALSDRP